MADKEERNNINPPAANPSRLGLWVLTGIATLLATVLFSAAIFGYARFGAGFVQARDNSVGEVLMREGKRLEEAHRNAKALETYELALKARFNGPQNRVFTLERAGILYWEQGKYEEAADRLARALDSSTPGIEPYEGLVDSLIELKRLDDARKYLDAWTRAANDTKDTVVKAKARHVSGKLAEAAKEPDRAVELYEACVNEYSYAPSAGRLGEIYAERGESAKALAHLERYFLLGSPGKNNAALRDLFSRLAGEAAE